MPAERRQEKAYIDTRSFAFFKCITALALALYASYYVRESAGLALRLLLTAVFCAAILGLNRWWDRAAPKRRNAAYTLGLGLVCLGSLRLFLPVSKSLIWLLLYVAVCLLLHAALEKRAPRHVTAAATLLGILFAFLTWMGFQLKTYDRLALLYFGEYTKDHVFEWVWFAGFALLLTAMLRLGIQYLQGQAFTDKPGDPAAWGLRRTLALSGGLLLCWLPYYIVFYPGCVSTDSRWELQQQLGLAAVSNHHPVMHQLVIRLGLAVGRLFGSLSLGVAAYSLIQMLLMALVFALCIRFLALKGANRGVLTAVFLFYGLYTINALYSISMWKDVLFGGFALLLTLQLIGEPPWERVGGKRRKVLAFLGLTLTAFLFCTMRNNGYYAFLLGFPFYILMNRKRWKPLLALGVLTVLLVSGYQGLLYNVLGVGRSGVGEALSVPLQQIARTVKIHGVDRDNGDFQILEEVLPDIEQLGEKYNSGISDPVKEGDTFLGRKFQKDPLRYGRSWLRLGLRYPNTYIDAALLQSYGYWYPDLDYFNVTPIIVKNDIGLEQNQRFAGLREKIILLHENLAMYRPTAILYSVGLLVWLELIAVVLLGMKKQWQPVSASLPIWAVWLTTLASPVFCEYRYLYALVVTVPLFLTLALCLPDRRKAGAS